MRASFGSTGVRVLLALPLAVPLTAQTTQRVSFDALGRQASGPSSFSAISGDVPTRSGGPQNPVPSLT